MKAILKIAVCCVTLFTAAAHAEDFIITNPASFGCTAKAYLAELISYLEDKDMVAFKSAFTQKYSAGSCVTFTQGEALIAMDSSSGVFKLRRRCATKAYWLSARMIKPV